MHFSWAIHQVCVCSLPALLHRRRAALLETRWRKNVVDGGGSRSLRHNAFHRVRDQPGGPRQLTAAAFPSLMRKVVLVLVEMVSGEDSREEGRVGYGMKTSGGT